MPPYCLESTQACGDTSLQLSPDWMSTLSLLQLIFVPAALQTRFLNWLTVSAAFCAWPVRIWRDAISTPYSSELTVKK